MEARRHKAISGLKGELIRIPTRLLGAEDELFKAMARRMEISGLAVRQARLEGPWGEAAKQRAAELVANPTDEMLEKALDYGRYVTFQRPLGRIAQPISNMTTAAPALKVVVPFVRTPTNLFKYVLERTPAAPFLKEVRDAIRAGGAERDLAVARVLVGTGIGTLIGHWAPQGIITGSEPSDRRTAALLRAQGWQPYSIRIGDTYYSYQRFDPFATIFGVAADLASSTERMTDEEREGVASALVVSIVQQVQSKTWLSGVSDLLKAIEDPDRFWPSYRDRLVGSIVVPTIVAHAARTIDPVQREARGPLDRIKSRIPWLSDNLPARRDVFGREVTVSGGLGPDFISPMWTSERRDDPVIRELLAAGARISQPSRRVAGRELSAEEFTRYQQLAGRYVYEDLASEVTQPGWAEMLPEDRAERVDEIATRARRDAREDLALDVPPLPPGFAAVRADQEPASPSPPPPPAPRQGGGLPPPPAGFELID